MSRPDLLMRRPGGSLKLESYAGTTACAGEGNVDRRARTRLDELRDRAAAGRRRVLKHGKLWCARRDCPALRASSLRDRLRCAPASNLACGQVVELSLFSAGSSNHNAELPLATKGSQARRSVVRPGEIRTPGLLVRSRRDDYIDS